MIKRLVSKFQTGPSKQVIGNEEHWYSVLQYVIGWNNFAGPNANGLSFLSKRMLGGVDLYPSGRQATDAAISTTRPYAARTQPA